MGQNWSDMWAAWEAGQPVDAAFKFFALSGNILTEVGRALVIGSVAKGLASAAISASRNLTTLLSLGEEGFLRVAAEDFSSWISRMLKSEAPEDIAALREFFQNNPGMKTKFLEGVQQGSRNIDEVAAAFRKGILEADDIKSFDLIKSADQVNADYLARNPGHELPWANQPITEFVTYQPEEFVRVSVDGTKSEWIVRKSTILNKTPQEIKDMLALPQEPMYVTDVNIPEGTKLREGIAGSNAFGTGGSEQFQILEDVLDDDWFGVAEQIGDKYRG